MTVFISAHIIFLEVIYIYILAEYLVYVSMGAYALIISCDIWLLAEVHVTLNDALAHWSPVMIPGTLGTAFLSLSIDLASKHQLEFP